MSSLRIMPFIDKSIFNFGLERYNQNMVDGAEHKYPIAAYSYNGGYRYKTGLDPFAPELAGLPSKEYDATVKQIKADAIKLEKELGGANIKADDADWFDKLRFLNPVAIRDDKGNPILSFWESDAMVFKLSTKPINLDLKNPHDKLKVIAIRAGGIPEIAPSYKDALLSNGGIKFYLDDESVTINEKVTLGILRDEAGAKLHELYSKPNAKFFYITKMVDPNSVSYTKSTDKAVLYTTCHSFIEGELTEITKRQACERFLEYFNMSIEELTIRSLIRDGIYYKVFGENNNGIYDKATQTQMGNNFDEVYQFLKSPANDAIYSDALNQVEEFWKM